MNTDIPAHFFFLFFLLNDDTAAHPYERKYRYSFLLFHLYTRAMISQFSTFFFFLILKFEYFLVFIKSTLIFPVKPSYIYTYVSPYH